MDGRTAMIVFSDDHNVVSRQPCFGGNHFFQTVDKLRGETDEVSGYDKRFILLVGKK